MSSHEFIYRKRIGRFAIWLLLAHIPLAAVTAMVFGSSVVTAVATGALLTAGPLLLQALKPGGYAALISIGAAAMGYSALLVYLSHGMIEMHFHVFVALALLVALASVTALISAAVTIAAHHVIFWLFVPAYVFNYSASFRIVLLHAVFVVAETATLVVVARVFRKMIALQGTMAESVAKIAQDVSEQTSVLRGTVGSFAGRASAQAAAIDKAAASVEEMNTMANRNAEDAQNVLLLANQTHLATQTGTKEMSAMVGAMDDIKASSGNIARIIKTIDEIAFQTNILALNAAVEAARAGAAGAGFAVVSEEVRNLAQRAAHAARETADLIEDSITKSSRGSEISRRVAESLSGIAEKTDQVNSLINSIAAASQEQSAGSVRIGAAINEIDQMTRKNAASAEETAAAVEELNIRAGQLTESVSAVMTLVRAPLAAAAPRRRQWAEGSLSPSPASLSCS